MDLKSVEKDHVVQDYDFILSSGLVVPLTIDPEAGDTIEFTDSDVIIKQSSRPSIDPDEEDGIPAETTRINRQHILVIQHRERVMHALTPEEKFQLQESLHKLPKGVQ